MTITESDHRTATGQQAAGTRGATKIYGAGDTQVVALNEVDCSFNAGQFTAIMGPSGSGKSTLMHCLAGLDRLSSGDAFIGSTSLSQLSEKDLTILRRTKIGFVFQAFNLVPTLTALENITLPADLGKASVDKHYLEQVIEAVGLGDRLGHKPRELSGGQQQRVAVARALSSRPDVIFADEPTGNLDSQTGSEILTFMRRAVTEFGQTIVMVTHDPVAASYTDRALFLNDGRIVNEMQNPDTDSILAAVRTAAQK